MCNLARGSVKPPMGVEQHLDTPLRKCVKLSWYTKCWESMSNNLDTLRKSIKKYWYTEKVFQIILIHWESVPTNIGKLYQVQLCTDTLSDFHCLTQLNLPYHQYQSSTQHHRESKGLTQTYKQQRNTQLLQIVKENRIEAGVAWESHWEIEFVIFFTSNYF